MLELFVLSDNNALEGYDAEHGLSILIKKDGRSILLDTGAGGNFATNGEKLGVDFSSVEAIVLSHGHYDHGGGLMEALMLCPDACLYTNPGWNSPILNADGRYIGVEAAAANMAPVIVQNIMSPMEGVHIIQGIGEHAGPKDKNFKIIQAGREIPDDFMHELVLVIEQAEGLYIFSGCSHSGADNICEHIKMQFPDRSIAAFIGGLHTYEKVINGVDVYAGTRDRVGRYFAGHPQIKRILTGHCTGQKGAEHLKALIGERIQNFCAGAVYRF